MNVRSDTVRGYLCMVVGCDEQPVGSREVEAPFHNATTGEHSTIRLREVWCADHAPEDTFRKTENA